MKISIDYVLSHSLQARCLVCRISRPDLVATLIWVQTASFQAAASTASILFLPFIFLFFFYPVDLRDDFHLLLVQEFEAGAILIAVGTLSAPPLPLPLVPANLTTLHYHHRSVCNLRTSL